VVATLSGVAGANAEAVDANAPRTIADRNFMMLLMYVAGTMCMVDGYYERVRSDTPGGNNAMESCLRFSFCSS